MLEFISNEHNLFPTPLWQIQIKGVDNDAIKEYCYHLKDNTEGVEISNRGGWHSKEILEPLPDALNELFSNFLGFVNDYCAQITGLNNLMLGNFWVNINQKYDYNRSHDHQNSILSGVYYVDCEGEDVGNFVVERDDSAEFFLGSYKNVSGFTGTSFAITPLTGFAFLMPSWVLHSVEQNLTDRDRISVAFNFVNPDVVPDNSYD
tara:strand:+ start:110 stop:724 length:615 start_codon:yes stop_codon:yes gene_type:complete